MSAARAVEDELRARGHQASTVDVLDHTGKGFRGWYRGGYEVLVKRRPKLWGHLYKTSDRKRFNYWFQTGLDTLFVSRMRRFLAHQKPDWVVCTHSLPQPVLARWRKRYGFKIAVVVTDLYPQLMWLRGRPDWFFVPGEWSREVLERRYSASRGRTTVTGIPINSLFAVASEKPEVRKSIGLDPIRPTVLVTSGGIGGGPIADVVRALRGLDAQVMVVCGRSVEALRSAQSELQDGSGPAALSVKGEVTSTEMARLMHSADLIVAKPGGITTFEALAAGLPFVVYDPFLIPGQEEKNAEFLVDSGIGMRAGTPETLFKSVSALLDDRSRLKRMSDNAVAHAKPQAAIEIVDTLESIG